MSQNSRHIQNSSSICHHSKQPLLILVQKRGLLGWLTWDPFEPPKFKHKRVPRASGSPPVPAFSSTSCDVKDQQDWKIPPYISNWKYPKGYTIPLDKRLAADGRGLQDVQINDNFDKLSEPLYAAEQKTREVVAMRTKVQKEMAMKEKERREHELRALAEKARAECSCSNICTKKFDYF